MTDPLKHCQTILHFGPEDEVDFHAEKQLKRAFTEYRQARSKTLATLQYMVNGEEYDSLLQAIAEVEILDTAGLRFVKPNLDENWDFNTPTKSIVLMGKGVGWVDRFDYHSFSLQKWDKSQHVQRERVMIRAFPTRFYYPQSIKTKSIDPLAGEKRLYIPKLMTLEELWSDIRNTGLVPFELRLCTYTKDSRFSYDLNLVDNHLLKDFRGGQVPMTNLAKRTAMDYMNFDMVLALTDMKDLVKRVFIELFEVKEATAFDISHSMGITDTMAKNCLDALVSRDVASAVGKPPRQIYSIDLEKLEAVAAPYI